MTKVHPFQVRRPYDGLSYDETKVHASTEVTELPELDEVSANERGIFEQRMIAKKGQSLDGTRGYGISDRINAAHFVIDKWLDESVVEDIFQRVVGRLDAPFNSEENITVYIPKILKGYEDVDDVDSVYNYLSIEYANVLTQKLNDLASEYPGLEFSAEKSIVIVSEHSRTFADAIGRIVGQQVMDVSDFEEGDYVGVVDEHSQASATLAVARSALLDKGAEVLFLSALSVHPHSHNLRAKSELLAAFEDAIEASAEHHLSNEKANDRLAEVKDAQLARLGSTLGKLGMSVGTLSNRELLTVIAYLFDGNTSNERFNELLSIAGGDEHENTQDSILPVLMAPARTVINFEQEVTGRLAIIEGNQRF